MKALVLIPLALLAADQARDAAGAPVWAVGVNPTTQGYDERIANGMIGWTFLLTGPATVTGLGWYDENLDGLSHPHQVGLWQYGAGSTNLDYGNTNALLVCSVIIPAGTNAILNGAYREVDLASPIELPIGSYVVAGTVYTQNPDAVRYVNGELRGDPRVLVGIPAYTRNDTNVLFQMPDLLSVDPFGWGLELGPNLLLLPPVASLQASRSGNQLVLSWPLWATNFVLQTSSVLGAGASWTTLTNPVSVTGDGLVSTNPISSTSAFYRLRNR